MNYLAHIYLARHDDDAMVGAWLGDFVKANQMDAFSPAMQYEIRLHRRVDTFTDQHPGMLAAKRLFPEGPRRYAGILLDVFGDFWLTRHWSTVCTESRTELVARFYAALRRHEARLPAHAVPVAERMIAQDWLAGYGSAAGVDATIRRIATRLSRNGDTMTAGLETLWQNESALQDLFAGFFPELQAYVEQQRSVARGVTGSSGESD